ncbi:MAG: hypothetical protein ABI840_05940 [bacterium]
MKIYDRKHALSKVQVDIWKIREKVYDEVKDLPVKNALEHIAKKAEKAGDEFRNKIVDKKNGSSRRRPKK